MWWHAYCTTHSGTCILHNIHKDVYTAQHTGTRILTHIATQTQGHNTQGQAYCTAHTGTHILHNTQEHAYSRIYCNTHTGNQHTQGHAYCRTHTYCRTQRDTHIAQHTQGHVHRYTQQQIKAKHLWWVHSQVTLWREIFVFVLTCLWISSTWTILTGVKMCGSSQKDVQEVQEEVQRARTSPTHQSM